jgi:hypothetical protein
VRIWGHNIKQKSKINKTKQIIDTANRQYYGCGTDPRKNQDYFCGCMLIDISRNSKIGYLIVLSEIQTNLKISDEMKRIFDC